MSERSTGKVKFFNENRGFGFIERDDGQGDIFVHISEVPNKEPLEENQRVSFEVGNGKQGKLEARRVTLE